MGVFGCLGVFCFICGGWLIFVLSDGGCGGVVDIGCWAWGGGLFAKTRLLQMSGGWRGSGSDVCLLKGLFCKNDHKTLFVSLRIGYAVFTGRSSMAPI